MIDHYRAAVVQMNSGTDKRKNIARAVRFVEEAAANGATFVALPELFNCLGTFPEIVAAAETIPGLTSTAMSLLARRLEVTLLAGSFCERDEPNGACFNTSLLFSSQGELIGRYRKIHLFDIDLPGQVTVTESRWMTPGRDVVTVATPSGRLGLTICYDLRFPELYRRLADAQVDVICAPAAFTHTTGTDHWETLVRARAIENQAYVIAPNQCGMHANDLATYGHSMIVDPWGTVLANAQEDEAVVIADIDRKTIADVRERLPALSHRVANL